MYIKFQGNTSNVFYINTKHIHHCTIVDNKLCIYDGNTTPQFTFYIEYSKIGQELANILQIYYEKGEVYLRLYMFWKMLYNRLSKFGRRNYNPKSKSV